MSDEIKIVQPQIQRAPARARGPLSSEDYNNFQDQVFADVVNLSEAVNTLTNQFQRALRGLESDNQQLRRRASALEERLSYREFANGKQQTRIDKYIDFHDTSCIIFPSNLPTSKRAEFKAQFGEIYIPANGIENKFYNFSLRTNQIVMASSFNTDVTSVFDKLEGVGAIDYEYGGQVSPGSPDNAFNGINEVAWTRSVTFALESTVEEVECQLTVSVPGGISSQANLLEIVPSPDGAIDLTHLSTAPNLSSSFTTVDNFLETNNIGSTRYHFSPRDVEQIRIRMRCRNWREINGKKVFTYGLQEVGLKLVDYNKLVGADQIFGDSITAVVKIKSPKDHVFNLLHRVDPYPNFYLEDVNNRHVRLRICSSPDFTNILWDSSRNVLPQQGLTSGIPLNGTSTLYAIYTLQFVKNSGGFQSPFPVSTTPVIKGLGLLFSATQSNNL